jgi:hypothetical protein
VARKREKGKACKFLVGKTDGNRLLGRIGAGRRIILK